MNYTSYRNGSSRASARQCWSITTTTQRACFSLEMNKNHVKVGGCLVKASISNLVLLEVLK